MSHKSPQRVAGIYRITVKRGDKPDKFYIGQANVCYSRRKYHFKALRGNRHSNPHLQNAFNKYGEMSFAFEIVLICERNKDILTMYEQAFVNFYGAKNLYNIYTQCVNSPLGAKWTQEMKDNHSRVLSGRTQTAEAIANVSEALKGHVVSDETKAKISASLTGKKRSLESRIKQSKTMTGRPQPWNVKEKRGHV